MKTYRFIGPVGGGQVPSNGVSVKNTYIVQFLKRHLGEQLEVYDTEYWKRSPGVLLRILTSFLFHRHDRYILSLNSSSAYQLLRLASVLGVSDILYWTIGGSLGESMVKGRFVPRYYQRCRHILVEGQSMQEDMWQCGVEKVSVVPNFKPIPQEKVVRRRSAGSPLDNTVSHTSGSPKMRFVFLSRIIPQKGCNDIFQAIDLLHTRGLDDRFEVMFYGPIEPSYRDSFQQQIAAHSTAQYGEFLDLREQLNYDILAAYDVMLFPTVWEGEGFPGVVIDAFIVGLPLIASDWHFNKDLVTAETGILVPPHSVEALANAMQYMIDHPDQVQAMSDHCQQKAGSYDVDYVLSDAFFDQYIKKV